MASSPLSLKRKRGPMEVLDPSANSQASGGDSLKRARSVKEEKSKAKRSVDNEDKKEGVLQGVLSPWDATFKNAKEQGKEVVKKVNGGDEVVDFESYLEAEERRKLEEKRRIQEKWEREKEVEPWKMSEPVGGRMINADPVFSNNEDFLFIAHRASIKVYSTSDSLLIRTIKLEGSLQVNPDAHIITYCLSPTRENVLWVAFSNGDVYNIDWTNGAGVDNFWGTSKGCIHMSVASMEWAGRRKDVVYTTEMTKDGGWRITAHDLAPPDGENATVSKTIYTTRQRIDGFTTAKEGSVIVGSAGKKILIGSLRSTAFESLNKVKYEFRIFEAPDYISFLDVRAYARKEPKTHGKEYPVVDVVVGDVKGAIFVHNDLLHNLSKSEGGNAPGISLIPRKLHWHRQAVHTVKWSRDGNYIISGGTETVLVLWQLDTGHRQMLPHMSATIQNVVVSPTGKSYGIQLADNSAMVLSTAELKPIANIAGVQACVVNAEHLPETHVQRVEGDSYSQPLIQRTPAIISPAEPSRLLLGVGQVQGVNPIRPAVTNVPFLQTYDLGSGNNISRQSLTRSNVTNVNITPSAHPVSEPRVTHMHISHDGNWFATVDHWTPPTRDLEYLGHTGVDLEAERQQRREVFLKFWQWNEETSNWALVSRIDTPHSLGSDLGGAGQVLDLIADPNSSRFCTIGEDNIVRIWITTIRKRDGVIVRDSTGKPLRNWTCQRTIPLCKSELDETSSHLHGCLAFSEDSSIIAAASTFSPGLLYLLDPFSGSVRHTITHLSPEGVILKLGFLAQNLIILSGEKLAVYDLVAEEMIYSTQLSSFITSLSPIQKSEMLHLALDTKSQTFAIALPSTSTSKSKGKAGEAMQIRSLQTLSFEICIFTPQQRQPLLKQSFPTLLTALISLPASASASSSSGHGYILLTASAEIYTLLPRGSTSVTSTARSIDALQLNNVTEAEPLMLYEEVDEDEEMEDIIELTKAGVEGEEEGRRGYEETVVTKEQLREVFDIGPAFALPSVEELFYRVVGLWDGKSVGVKA